MIELVLSEEIIVVLFVDGVLDSAEVFLEMSVTSDRLLVLPSCALDVVGAPNIVLLAVINGC